MPARRLPSLHALRAFEAVARHLSVTRAAAELAVTPGAVSRLLRMLAEELGTALFVRRGGGIELTPAGRDLGARAREALDQLEEAVTGLRLHRPRRLSIGVYGHILSRALLPILPDLARDLPGLELDLHAGTNPLEMLPTRFDAVIAVGDATPRPGFVVRPLMPITTVAVAAPRRLAEGPLDFAAVPMLHTRARPEDWRRWLDHAGLAAIPVRGGSTFESATQTLEAVAADLGAAIAIEGLLGPDLAAGHVAVAHPARRPTRRSFTLEYEARLGADPALAAFADWLAGRLGA